jgi:DNA-binding NtrC family response regulator/pSer/pThr/pTyr-binding forkhead associated (FHA) protein
MADPRQVQETQDAQPAPRAAEWRSLQLVIVQDASSQVVPLRAGPFTIGRADEADLVIDDPSISRLHTRLLVTDERVVLTDLGSRNGTQLNGASLAEPRAIAPGDVITLGKVTVVVQGQRAHGEDALLMVPALRERLAEEVARALHYERPLAVLALSVGAGGFTGPQLAQVRQLMRAHDRASLETPSVLLILLPELDEDEARQLAEQALARLGPDACAGLSLFPEDGTEGEPLLWAAREAASAPRVRLARELVLREQLGDQELLVADPAMRGLYRLVQRLAPSDLPVLVTGETGTGKELVALSLHKGGGGRAEGPFVPVNCAALPETLAESELFGHERGAFTGAATSKVGYFEAAHGGTLFLDEVGELPLALQAKLLRAVETRQIVRLGDTRPTPIDARLVAATNRDLLAEVKAGRFREDLYFRLCAARVALPPLRSRPREIPLLARAFLERECRRLQRDVPALGANALAQLSAHLWPGNVRELRNAMATVAALHEGPTVDEIALGAESVQREPPPAPVPQQARRAFPPIAEELRGLERARMVEALEASGGVQKKAAQLIGMPLRTFVLKARQYGLQKGGIKPS